MLGRIFLGVHSAFAQSSLIPSGGVLGPCNFRFGNIHYDCIPVYIGYLVQFAVATAGAFFLLGIMLGGYYYAFGPATGQGTEKGKKALTWSIVGISVCVLSYLLVDFIIYALYPI